MKKILFFSLLILFLFSTVQGQKKNSQNDYSKLLSESGVGKLYKNAPYIIVFEETNTKMMDSGLNHVNKEILFKVLTKKGAKSLHSYILAYDPGSAYIEFKKVQIIKKNGRVIDVPLSGVKDYTAPARANANGTRPATRGIPLCRESGTPSHFRRFWYRSACH